MWSREQNGPKKEQKTSKWKSERGQHLKQWNGKKRQTTQIIRGILTRKWVKSPRTKHSWTMSDNQTAWRAKVNWEEDTNLPNLCPVPENAWSLGLGGGTYSSCLWSSILTCTSPFRDNLNNSCGISLWTGRMKNVFKSLNSKEPLDLKYNLNRESWCPNSLLAYSPWWIC